MKGRVIGKCGPRNLELSNWSVDNYSLFWITQPEDIGVKGRRLNLKKTWLKIWINFIESFDKACLKGRKMPPVRLCSYFGTSPLIAGRVARDWGHNLTSSIRETFMSYCHLFALFLLVGLSHELLSLQTDRGKQQYHINNLAFSSTSLEIFWYWFNFSRYFFANTAFQFTTYPWVFIAMENVSKFHKLEDSNLGKWEGWVLLKTEARDNILHWYGEKL